MIATFLSALVCTAPAPPPQDPRPQVFLRQEDFVRDLFDSVGARRQSEVESLCRRFPLRSLHVVRDLLRRANLEADDRPRDLARAIAGLVPGDLGEIARRATKRDAELTDAQRRDAHELETAIARMGTAHTDAVLKDSGNLAVSLARRLRDPYLLARAYGLLGFRLHAMGHSGDAAEPLRRAVDGLRELAAPLELARDLQWLAEVRLAAQRWQPAHDALTTAVENAAAVTEHHLSVELLGRRAYAATRLGQTASAEADLAEAIRIATALPAERGGRQGEARTREARASFYTQTGRYGEALLDLQRVEKIWRGLEAPVDHARSLSSLAGISAELGRHVDASEFAARAAARLTEPEHDPARSRALRMQALALLDAGDAPSAFPVIAEAHGIAVRAGRETDIVAALLLRGRANLTTDRIAASSRDFAESLRRSETAQDSTHRVLALLGLGEATLGTGDLERARTTFAEALADPAGVPRDEVTWRAHFGLGRVEERESNLAAARRHFAVAIAAVESLRAGLSSPELRLRFLDRKLELYWRAARLAVLENALEDAFRFCEAAKARTLLKLDVHSPPSPRRDRGRTDLPALSTLREALPPNVAILEYQVGREGTIAWIIRRESAQAQILPATADSLEAGVSSLLAPIGQLVQGVVDTANLRFDARKAHAIWSAVIEPVTPRLGGCSELWIVADGPLRAVPFPALVSRHIRLPVDPSRIYTQYSACRFLVEDFAIARVPTAALLMTKRGAPRGDTDLLLIGAPQPMPVGSSNTPLPRLPGALREIRGVEESKPGRNVTLTGSDATEQAFRSRAGDAAVLHFATHAELDARRPAYSRLALAPGSSHDGWLYAHEIQEMNLTAETTVLSACQGLGAPGGDGLLGIARAFLRAGVDRVLATAWPTEDETAARIIEGYYRGLADSLLPARALQRAQLEILRKGRSQGDPTSHPFFWGGWVLLGQPRSR